MAEEVLKKCRQVNGIWFFGLAGAGKTFASEICAKLIDKAFIIDGDDVRNFISFDLGYSSSDREIQIKRVLGLSEITLKNNRMPIVSTVTMSHEINMRCNQLGIELVNIIRPNDQLSKVRKIYEAGTNVVGKDIKEKSFDTLKLCNNGDAEFEKRIKLLVK